MKSPTGMIPRPLINKDFGVGKKQRNVRGKPTKKKRSALFMYGGGNFLYGTSYMVTFGRALSRLGMFDHVYVGMYSFACFLMHTTCIKEFEDVMSKHDPKKLSPAFFGTSRGIDFESSENDRQIAIEVCKKMGITDIYVSGRDGSARYYAAIMKYFKKCGIAWHFTMPCTIDGIVSGYSLGLDAAVSTTVKYILESAETNLRTLERCVYTVSMVTVMGRNRDDILEGSLRLIDVMETIADYPRNMVQVIALPANYKVNMEELRKKLDFTRMGNEGGPMGKPTLIIRSEGCSITEKDMEALCDEMGVKARCSSVGYPAQGGSNQIPKTERAIKQMVSKMMPLIARSVGRPNTIVFNAPYGEPSMRLYNYFSKLNPRDLEATPQGEAENFLLEFVP